MTDSKPNAMEKIKHIIMTGESVGSEQRRAELEPKIGMADKTYRFVLIFFVLLFWVVVIWKNFA